MNFEIDRSEWARFLESLTKRRFEWRTEISVLSPANGDQVLSKGLWLLGFTLDTRAGQTTVEVATMGPDLAHQTHSIMNPERILFLESENGQGDVVNIQESDGTKTLVRFMEPKGLLVGFERAAFAAAAG